MAAFIESEINKGASENTVRRLKATIKMVYEFLPEDKLLTRERLLEWRADLNDRGYAYQTIQNYVKWINQYLDYARLSEIRFNRGKGKDISGTDKGETLSPKYAPDIMAPAIQPGSYPCAVPIPTRATPTVAMVVQELPVITAINAHITQVAKRKISGKITFIP